MMGKMIKIKCYLMLSKTGRKLKKTPIDNIYTKLLTFKMIEMCNI